VIKKVTLKDFQIHKNLELEFGKFTTLTGGSNGGKSAVLRAISGLTKNSSPANYVRRGQQSLSVTIEFDDGQKIEWQKGEKVNKYIITDAAGATRVLDKVGAGVPEEVSDILRLGPVAVKGSDKEYINFHNQLEAPFLISSTPGNVAKLFGELTSASQLYTAVGEGNRQARHTNGLKATRKEDLDGAIVALDAYTDLDEHQRSLTKAGKLYEEAVSIATDLEACQTTIARIQSINEAISKLEDGIELVSVPAGFNLEELRSLADTSLAFELVIDALNKKEEAIVQSQRLITDLSQVPDIDLTALEELETRISIVSGFVTKLDDLDEKIKLATGHYIGAEERGDRLDEQLDEKFSELSTCPECEQPLTDSAKTVLIEGRHSHAAC